jgi:hypothetical protein
MMAIVTDQKSRQEQRPSAKQVAAPAYWAMDYYFDNLKKIVLSAPTGGTEVGEKIKRYAEKNLANTHEFMRRLSQARDFRELVQLQNEFLHSQIEVIAEQTKGLGEAFSQETTKATKWPFKNST